MHGDALTTLDLPTIIGFADEMLVALGAAREEIDALNVYPVPDRDTGTNLFLTFESARTEMLDRIDVEADADAVADVRVALAAFARGTLLGARGSSGVIMSQLVGAVVRRVVDAAPGERPGSVFAEGMLQATQAGYAAVGEPVEGTILSVARAASDAALEAARHEGSELGQVIGAAASAGRSALERTPLQLRVLQEAGVVDAGGRGLCVVLDAAESAVTGRRVAAVAGEAAHRSIPSPLPTTDVAVSGAAYEVMYLLDAEDTRIPQLRSSLGALGDSLVVVGAEGLWNVHVHVDDVGAAVEAGVEAGRPYRIRVTHLVEQRHRGDAPSAAAKSGRQVVVVSAGDGLTELFTRAGATVVASGRVRRPSAAQILEAVSAAAATEVVILPNDPGSLVVAEAAARTAREYDGLVVAVIPTSAQVQGLAAMAVHEPARGFAEDVLAMTAAARHARSGAVTVAVKQAITTAGRCEPGDVLGVVEGDFVVVGTDVFTVCVDVLDRLLGGGGELVTIVAGADAGDLAGRCAAYVAEQHPGVDVVVHDGGQERYPVLVGVE